ncbi:hypothetical protein ACF3OH_12080 [Chryseomicrobium aureum]
MDRNISARIIDELNERLEHAIDNEESEKYEALNSFYDWFVENYIL